MPRQDKCHISFPPDESLLSRFSRRDFLLSLVTTAAIALTGWGGVPGATCVGPNGMIYVSSIDNQVYAIK